MNHLVMETCDQAGEVLPRLRDPNCRSATRAARFETESSVMTPSRDRQAEVRLTIDGGRRGAKHDERPVEVIARVGGASPNVCYHPQLGAIQTCDTCMVEVDGQLARACATGAVDGMVVSTASPRARAAQVEAFDRILSNHLLYCTVCDNNNGDCTVHTTTK